MSQCTIEVYTHYFSIKTLHYNIKKTIEALEQKLQQWDFKPEKGRIIRIKGDRFYWVNEYKTEWRFHISLWETFLNTVKPLYFFNEIKIKHMPLYTPKKVEYVIDEKYKDRDYQTPAIQFLSRLPANKQEEQTIGRNRLLKFRTGRGKSYTCMRALQERGEVALGLIRAGYLNKWEADLRRTYVLGDDELVVIDGTTNLKKFFTDHQKGKYKNAKIFLFSLEKFKSWVKSYNFYGEELRKLGFECLPDELCEFLGVGVRIMDEVHQHFHATYMADLYTNVPLSIGLSATLITRDHFLKQRHKEAYPIHQHYADDAAIIYANAQAVHFAFNRPDYIRTHEHGDNRWSQNAYESSIFNHKPTLFKYLDMLAFIAKESFGKVKREKKKLLILAFRLDMIEMITVKMKRTFPELVVNKYINHSPFSDLVESDIVVSNYGKAGTAVDVPDLTNLLVTINMAADHANIQIIGRLRQLPDHDVLMQILVCDNIERFRINDKERRVALSGHVKSYTDIGYGFIL